MKSEWGKQRQTFDPEDAERGFAAGEDGQTSANAEAGLREDTGHEARENRPRGPSAVERLWLAAAAAFLIAAAVLLLLAHTDAAFVSAALGVCSWFLNVRDRLKREHGLRKRGRRDWGTGGDDSE